MSALSEELLLQLRAAKLTDGMVTEFRFHPERKWRFDFAWPAQLLALEVDGGVWTGGKHGRGSGIVKDQEKRNAAAVAGWRILVVLPRELTKTTTLLLIDRALQAPAAAAALPMEQTA